MKKLLISSLAVLAMATSSLTLAATYSNGTDTSSTGGKPKKAEAMTTEKVTVIVTGTGKGGRPLNATEVTVNQERVEGHSFVLQESSPIVKVADNRCESTNAHKLVGKQIKEVRVEVKDGACKTATFVAAK